MASKHLFNGNFNIYEWFKPGTLILNEVRFNRKTLNIFDFSPKSPRYLSVIRIFCQKVENLWLHTWNSIDICSSTQFSIELHLTTFNAYQYYMTAVLEWKLPQWTVQSIHVNSWGMHFKTWPTGTVWHPPSLPMACHKSSISELQWQSNRPMEKSAGIQQPALLAQQPKNA